MASIEKRSNNSYRITVSSGYDSQGKQIRKKRTVTLPAGLTERQKKKEIQKQTVLFEREVQNGTYLDGDKITFAEFSEKWLTDYAKKELAPKTVERYKTLLTRINQGLGNLKLCKIQPPHIISFMSNLAEDGIRTDDSYTLKADCMLYIKEHREELSEAVNPRTILNILKGRATNGSVVHKIADVSNLDMSAIFIAHNTKDKLSSQTLLHHFKLLNTILNTAVRWNLLLNNPAARVSAPRVEQKEIQSLDDEEIEKMLEYLESEPLKYQAAVYVALFGGLRLGELIALKWRNIDLEKSIMSIKNSVQKNLKFDEEGNVIHQSINRLANTKTLRSTRAFIIPEVVKQTLLEWRERQEHMGAAIGIDYTSDEQFVFCTQKGEMRTYHSLHSLLTRFRERHGFEKEKFNLYTFRHTFATMLLEARENPEIVARLMGHSKVTTTLLVYSHVVSQDVYEETETTLDGAFAKTSEKREKNQSVMRDRLIPLTLPCQIFDSNADNFR